jgi:hypothetical protein
MREYAFDLGADAPTPFEYGGLLAPLSMPPHPALNFHMWGRCGPPEADPHMPHTQPLSAEPRIGSAKPAARLVIY